MDQLDQRADSRSRPRRRPVPAASSSPPSSSPRAGSWSASASPTPTPSPRGRTGGWWRCSSPASRSGSSARRSAALPGRRLLGASFVVVGVAAALTAVSTQYAGYLDVRGGDASWAWVADIRLWSFAARRRRARRRRPVAARGRRPGAGAALSSPATGLAVATSCGGRRDVVAGVGRRAGRAGSSPRRPRPARCASPRGGGGRGSSRRTRCRGGSSPGRSWPGSPSSRRSSRSASGRWPARTSSSAVLLMATVPLLRRRRAPSTRSGTTPRPSSACPTACSSGSCWRAASSASTRSSWPDSARWSAGAARRGCSSSRPG